jgi:plasmid stabilization system protein ParE
LTAAVPVEWSPQARRGLRLRARFLRDKSPSAAAEAVATIFAASDGLGIFPGRGRPYDRSPKRFRELVVPFGGEGYLLLYEVKSDRVRILGVKHQREATY